MNGQLRYKADFRNGLTVEQSVLRHQRRIVNAMFANARLAGRHLAKLALSHGNDDKISARGLVQTSAWSRERLINGYRVHPDLVSYASKVAMEKLR